MRNELLSDLLNDILQNVLWSLNCGGISLSEYQMYNALIDLIVSISEDETTAFDAVNTVSKKLKRSSISNVTKKQESLQEPQENQKMGRFAQKIISKIRGMQEKEAP